MSYQPIPIPNIELDTIEQYHDGRFRISVARKSVDLEQTSSSSTNNLILLPFQNLNISYRPPPSERINFQSTRVCLFNPYLAQISVVRWDSFVMKTKHK